MVTVMAFIAIVRAIMVMVITVMDMDTELSSFLVPPLTAAPSVTQVRRGNTFLWGEGRDQRNA